ncbi:MAG: aldehyde dehydrogenase family protein, partial [Bacteroidia bacterium]|nr:aldehyde dehydrogenase family protein [Bacteroidia bacterium]
MKKILNYINGQLMEPVSGTYLDNFDPSTGKVYSLCPDSDERDVELATEAALKAFVSWSVMAPEKRSRIMLRIAELIEKNLDALAEAES